MLLSHNFEKYFLSIFKLIFIEKTVKLSFRPTKLFWESLWYFLDQWLLLVLFCYINSYYQQILSFCWIAKKWIILKDVLPSWKYTKKYKLVNFNKVSSQILMFIFFRKTTLLTLHNRVVIFWSINFSKNQRQLAVCCLYVCSGSDIF